jgi:glucose/arabinose dehydrogenase
MAALGATLVLTVSAYAQGPIAAPITKGSAVIELQTVATGLFQPTNLTHAGDGSGRNFIVERNGIVRILNGTQVAATPFMDISSRVLGGGERGLLGLAFHPGYDDPTSVWFRTLYTYTSESATGTPDFGSPGGGAVDHHSVVTEWKVSATDPSVVDLSSRREVMRIAQPQINHNGGALAFSPVDGHLYIALGDGGGGNDVGSGHSASGNGQDSTNILGDILRIDPVAPALTAGSGDAVSANGQYRIPANNPFVNASGADEIFATGFRNPYRMSFDPVTGQLVAADVGQDNIEEVDIVTIGGNYGWNYKEGTFLFNPLTGGVSIGPDPVPGLIDPVLQYDHDEGNSIIGGFVYRGSALTSLIGSYIFGDLNGRLFVGDLSTGAISQLVIGLDDRALGGSLIGFGEDEQNELYVLTTNFSATGGVVRKIVPVAPEPGSIVLMAVGGLALGGTLWRRARR